MWGSCLLIKCHQSDSRFRFPKREKCNFSCLQPVCSNCSRIQTAKKTRATEFNSCLFNSVLYLIEFDSFCFEIGVRWDVWRLGLCRPERMDRSGCWSEQRNTHQSRDGMLSFKVAGGTTAQAFKDHCAENWWTLHRRTNAKRRERQGQFNLE